MRLYIQIQDGNPINHPLLEDNVVQVWPEIDLDNPPIDRLAKFERIPQPPVGVYEVYQGVTYEWKENIVSDVHHIRPMTLNEQKEKQDFVINRWTRSGGWASWILDEETCQMVAPVPHPNDGSIYQWDETTCTWTDIAVGSQQRQQ